MIPWFVWAGLCAILLLAYMVNESNILFWLGAAAAASMVATIFLGLVAPPWLEVLIFGPGLGLCLIYIGGPRRGEAGLSARESRKY